MRRRTLELFAIAATGLLYWPVVHVLGWRTAYVAAAMGGWTTYVVVRALGDRDALRDWGLRRDNLREAFVRPTVVAAPAAALMAAVGLVQGTFSLHWHLGLLLLLYPFWGLVQQLLVQGVLASNLDRQGLPVAAVAVLAALGFAVVHYPERWLMLGTFAMGLVFTPLYLRRPNLIPLGLYHGWLGALYFFWVLGRDPYVEMGLLS